MDAIGVSRYLPVFIYRRGHPEDSAYIGYRMESFEKRLDKFWPATVTTTSNGTQDAMRLAAERIKSFGSDAQRIGVERAFIPADAETALHQALPQAEIVDALFPLERLRARKSAAELALLREASDRVVAAMLATFDACRSGMTKSQLVETLRQEEVKRGLTFDYCLITAGTETNRAPSDQRIAEGDILSLDSGGNYHGYIGDLCRMGILGEPDAELEDLLGVIEMVQMHARKPIKAGARGGDVFDAAEKVLAETPHRRYMEFLAHGMGLVSHEAPRLTDKGPVPYEAHDAELPLQSGMVVSVRVCSIPSAASSSWRTPWWSPIPATRASVTPAAAGTAPDAGENGPRGSPHGAQRNAGQPSRISFAPSELWAATLAGSMHDGGR